MVSTTDTRRSANDRGYTSRWHKARTAYLASHPLCTMCKEEGKVTPAKVVDHVIPHKGDRSLFWDSGNWQSLCYRHHNSTKQSMERATQYEPCDVEGIPLDPSHHWNANRARGGGVVAK